MNRADRNVVQAGPTRYLNLLEAWALSIGCAVGWGAFVMPGTTFLPLAGPAGTALGMIIGAAVMLIIGVNYHFLMNKYPDMGGTLTYSIHAFGYDHGLLSAWFLMLVYIAIMWANATANVLIVRNLFGGALQWGFHYQVAGYHVYCGEVLLTLAIILIFGVICAKNKRLAIVIQTVMAFILVLGVIICAVAVLGKNGGFTRIAPAYAPAKRGAAQQIVQIVVLAPWAFVGFESISNSTESFRFSPKKSIWVMIAALIAGTACYVLLALIAASDVPAGYGSWVDYVSDLDDLSGYASIPTFYAVNEAMGATGLAILGVSITAGIVTGLVGNYIAASHLMYAMTENGILPEWFGRLDKKGNSANPILFLMAISIFVPFVGRAAIGWIVDVNTIGALIAYAYTSTAAYKMARADRNAPVQITGIIGLGLSMLFFLYFMVPNIWTVSGLSRASYFILIAWSVLGFLLFQRVFRRDTHKRFGKTTAVWIVLLFMILFTSMLWLREATHETTDRVLSDLSGYNETELVEHGVALSEEDESDAENYLQQKMSEVNRAIVRHSWVQMTVIVIVLMIMFNIYMGMHIDFAELIRVKQETVEAKAAFEEAQSASTMYSHIAHALSSNYDHLYYVDTETGDFLDYNTGKTFGEPVETKGTDYFNTSKRFLKENIHPDDWAEFERMNTRENVLRAIESRGEFTITYRAKFDGDYSYFFTRAIRLAEDDNHIMVGVGLNEDIETRNALTGLRAETSFYVRGRELLQEHPQGWCVIAVDLEHFKLFNEWYGREAGDMLLAQIGEFLNTVETGNRGIAGYLGQDDFALLILYDKEQIRKIFDSIHGFIMERGNTIGFMPAFGICMADHNTSVEELLDRASQAAQHAKENYHNRIRIFEESMYQQTERDYQILSDFQSALQNNELFIMLQPQCELAQGRVVGAESLVRWKKADGSMVSPGVFVPVLERYGFVTDLDQFVWDEVCAWQRKWIDSGHTPLPVSVNVSQIDIFAIDVPSHFELLLWKYKLPVDAIKIEITESAYVGDGAVADTVKRLREKGFLVLMDDFGSGYSSLNMLRSLNVDIIKLDAQFLRMNSDDRKGVQILESIVGMAKSMEAPIIVEGVETEEEMSLVKSLGCRYVQGYYFYRPMPLEDYESLIGDEKNIDTSGFKR